MTSQVSAFQMRPQVQSGVGQSEGQHVLHAGAVGQSPNGEGCEDSDPQAEP